MRNILTFKSMCEIIGVDIPEKFQPDEHVQISSFSCFGSRIRRSDSALFIRGLLDTGKKSSHTYNESAARLGYRNGARFIFSTEQYYTESGDPLPCILVDDPSALFIKLSNALRRELLQSTKVVAVTGSVGKTTTTEMMSLVAGAKFKTYHSEKNTNGFASISNHLQTISTDYSVYVQEVGAYFPGLVEADAMMLEPDACVITNIGTSHVDLYGTVENIVYDKLALTRHLTPNGMAFVNYDDATLRRQKYDCNVTWFSLDNPEADFYAANVKYGDGMIEYDIIGDGATTHIRLASYGMHNIINSVVAFAFGCWCGIPKDAIAAAFLKFKTEGIRQNYCNIGGYRLYIDCFNSAPNSLESAIETVTKIPIGEGCKRIAVLGDMLKMGELSSQLHIDCGKALAKYNIDLFLCYGPYMYYMANELKQRGCRVMYTASREQLDLWVAANVHRGDLVLFKSGHRMYLARTIDKVFGTSFYLTDLDVLTEYGKTVEADGFTASVVHGQAAIRKCTLTSDKIVVPSKIGNAQVVRIGADVFNRKRMNELVIEEGITIIGFAACYVCTNLKTLTLPTTLRVIERSAFNYCTNLEVVTLPDSVTNIEARAFYDCRALEKIVIGENVGYIGNEAFHNCRKLTIYGTVGSYAEQYAKREGIPFQSIQNND